MTRLTHRGADILETIRWFTSRGAWCSSGQITARLGLRRSSDAGYYLERLKNAGLIEMRLQGGSKRVYLAKSDGEYSIGSSRAAPKLTLVPAVRPAVSVRVRKSRMEARLMAGRRYEDVETFDDVGGAYVPRRGGLQRWSGG